MFLSVSGSSGRERSGPAKGMEPDPGIDGLGYLAKKLISGVTGMLSAMKGWDEEESGKG